MQTIIATRAVTISSNIADIAVDRTTIASACWSRAAQIVDDKTLRAAVIILMFSVSTFVVAFVLRRTFFSDVMPISWDYEQPANGALQVAFLLLTIENVAGFVAAIALVFLIAFLMRAR